MIRLTPDLQKKAAIIGGFVLFFAGYLYYQLHDDSAAPVAQVASVAPVTAGPAAAKGGAEAKKLGTTSAQLDPTLRMGPMLVAEALVYSGSGRNIFSLSSAPVELPKLVASVRTKGATVAAGPPPPPPGPPPPPPIDLKFFGTATSANGKRKAFLLHGDDVFLASDGDVVQRRYKVQTVLASSIVVVDLSNNNKQTLPLLAR